MNKWHYLSRDLWFFRWKALGASLRLYWDWDFERFRKTSGFFGRLRTSSGIFGNDHVVFKNLSTPRIKISGLYLRKSWQVYNNYSMSPSWIWSDKITNERIARVGYNHFISNKGKWNNCFSKFSNQVLPPIFIFTILQSGKFLNLADYFPYNVKLRLLADSWSFLANQKARNAIFRAENFLNCDVLDSHVVLRIIW